MRSDEVWVVFDRDSFEPETFNQAFALASTSNILVAYTNEAFELWYLLHFDYSDANLSRSTYKERLSDALGSTYQKNDESMYHRLKPLQPAAIRHAIKLRTQYGEEHNPEKDNPSTSVHRLVCRLNQQRPGAAPEGGCWCGLGKHCLGPFSG